MAALRIKFPTRELGECLAMLAVTLLVLQVLGRAWGLGLLPFLTSVLISIMHSFALCILQRSCSSELAARQKPITASGVQPCRKF